MKSDPKRELGINSKYKLRSSSVIISKTLDCWKSKNSFWEISFI